MCGVLLMATKIEKRRGYFGKNKEK